MWMLISLISIAIVMFLENLRERHTLKVTKYRVNSPKLPRLEKDKKIIFLTDLHNKTYGESNEKIIKIILKEKPDCIFIGGDMVLGIDKKPCDVALKLIRRLTKISKVYYANGNHEQRMKEHPEKYGNDYKIYRKKLKDCGVIFLENQSISLYYSPEIQDKIQITGVEIPEKYYRKFPKGTLKHTEIEALIGEGNREKYQILLAHNPAHINTYINWGADLVLSGHYHGGMVRIPFLGGAISPQGKLFPPYAGGQYRFDKSDIIVSRGLGEHTIKVRLFNEPEVVVVHLNGEKK